MHKTHKDNCVSELDEFVETRGVLMATSGSLGPTTLQDIA